MLSYLSKDFILILDEADKITKRAQNIQSENKNLIENLIEKEKFVPEAIRNLAEYEYDLEEDFYTTTYICTKCGHFEFFNQKLAKLILEERKKRLVK